MNKLTNLELLEQIKASVWELVDRVGNDDDRLDDYWEIFNLAIKLSEGENQ